MLNEAQDLEIYEVPAGTDLKADASRSFWSNAKWRTLFSLIETRGYLPITELAKAVGLTVNDAVAALEAMELLGFVKKSERGYEQTRAYMRRYRHDFLTNYDIISDYLLSASQVNNRMLETMSDDNHRTRSLIYNSNKQLIAELYSNIDRAIEEFKIKSENQKDRWDGVYALSVALIEMTKELKS